MGSTALDEWRSTAAQRLDELEAAHGDLTGGGPGRRWGTQQLNLSMFVALAAQFQFFCRSLHDAAVEVQASVANPHQEAVLRVLLTEGRKLDVGNARRSSLGHDFNRLGFRFIDRLKAQGQRTEQRLHKLDALIDVRNNIAHGDYEAMRSTAAAAGIDLTKPGYRRLRRALDLLASTMDRVVGEQLAQTLVLEEQPW